MSSKPQVTEREILTALMCYVLDHKNHKLAVPNANGFFGGMYEADLISATRAGLVHEWEVKCSLADYKRDFRTKRWKHQLLAFGNNRSIPCYFWFVLPCWIAVEVPSYAGLALYDPDRGTYWWSRIVIKKPAPRLVGRRVRPEDYQKAARLLSFRLKNEFVRPRRKHDDIDRPR